MAESNNHSVGRASRGPNSHGPLPFMNSTTRRLAFEQKPAATEEPAGGDLSHSQPFSAPAGAGDEGPYFMWRSRDNRKGRHAVALAGEGYKHAGGSVVRPTNTAPEILRGIGKLFVRYPIWDVSYDVAITFVLGSIVWVINSFFVWLPLQDPDTTFPGESTMGGGVTAFIGATIFSFGSALMMLEAVNENRTECFGWALEQTTETGPLLPHPSPEGCQHSHNHRKYWLRGKGTKSVESGDRAADERPDDSTRSWSWWPSWHELQTHYVKEIGFWACLIQLAGASIFWIAGLTGLPPILDALSLPVENGIYWVPQVVGGTGFIISGVLFSLETQRKWYIPAPGILGWHIGFWNLIGGIGFTMCGAFGFASADTNMEYASTLSTFIGSWAFLIGSVLQWYETLDKYPITVE